MKYMKKPTVVEAFEFKLGLEDGFLSDNNFIPADAHKFPEKYRSKLYPRYHRDYDGILSNAIRCGRVADFLKPYIDFPKSGKIPIPFGSFIVAVEDDFEVYTKEDFDKEFFPCEEE